MHIINGIVGGLVDENHAEFDLCVDLKFVLMRGVVFTDFLGRHDDVR